MSTYLLSIGINDYTDRAFKALTCCENDATEIHALFKRNLELGERARKLVGRVTTVDVKNELRRIGQEIRNGDTFVFFFAGHGYQHPKREDQFLLFPEAEARLVNKGYLDGMLSLSALCELTDHWAGVARVFVLDACRTWLPGGRSAQGEAFDNESALAYIASRDPRSHAPTRPESGDQAEQQSGVEALPPLILNATKNGEVAQELERQGRGVLALALERTLEAQSKAGDVVWLGQQNLGEIGEEMQRLLRADGSGASQAPFMVPSSGKVLLFKPRVGKDEKTGAHKSVEQDELDWALAKAKGTLDALETYARNHPLGAHVKEAVARVAELSDLVRDEVAREANAKRVAAERAVAEAKRIAEEARQEVESLRRRQQAETEKARNAAQKKAEADDFAHRENEKRILSERLEKEARERQEIERKRQEKDFAAQDERKRQEQSEASDNFKNKTQQKSEHGSFENKSENLRKCENGHFFASSGAGGDMAQCPWCTDYGTSRSFNTASRIKQYCLKVVRGEFSVGKVGFFLVFIVVWFAGFIKLSDYIGDLSYRIVLLMMHQLIQFVVASMFAIGMFQRVRHAFFASDEGFLTRVGMCFICLWFAAMFSAFALGAAEVMLNLNN